MSHWFDYGRREMIFGDLSRKVFEQVIPGANVVKIDLIIDPGPEETTFTVYVDLFQEGRGDFQETISVDWDTDRVWWDGVDFMVAEDNGQLYVSPALALI